MPNLLPWIVYILQCSNNPIPKLWAYASGGEILDIFETSYYKSPL